MSIVMDSPIIDNVTPEVAGRRLFLAGAFWMEPETAHVCDGDHIYIVPVLSTGPVCYCTEFAQWGVCAHSECILNAMGEAGPTAEDEQRGMLADCGIR